MNHSYLYGLMLLLAFGPLRPLSAAPAGAGQPAHPRVSVVISPSAAPLEKFAAAELKGYLKKLFAVDAAVGTEVPAAGRVFRVGVVKPGSGPTKLTVQGILLQPGGRTLVVGGGSPAATLWAVYELVERWGVRFLLHGDVLPQQPGKLRFPVDHTVVIEPQLPVRQWRVVNDFACGPESWGMADYRPVLDQLAKMKFNRILVSVWVWQPFLDLRVQGIQRRSAALWFNYRYPITDDMPGRALFGKATEFWNPDFPPRSAGYRPMVAAGQTLLHRLMAYAHRRGMQCVLTAHITEFPPEFAPLLRDAEKVHQLAALTVVPGPKTPPDDPKLTQLATAVLRATVNTYPEADFIQLGMPEWRQWADRDQEAWQALDTKYGISSVRSLPDVLAAAARRRGYPGGAARAVREVKGDIVLLEFYDRLLRNPATLAGTRRPAVPFIYCAVAEELFPLLGKILPPGSETLNFIDYTASRVVKRRAVLRRLPVRAVPAVLIYTLHDDNVGLLPQLATGSLHELTRDLRQNGWAGFSTRYWLISDHDPCVAYLARAAWDATATPERVYRDQVGHVCGRAAVPDMGALFQELERVTLTLEGAGLGVTFPVPGMFTGQMRAAPMPAWMVAARAGYRRALDSARRARRKCSVTGRPYVDYWIGRLTFGAGYFDCIEAARRTARAEAAAREARRTGAQGLANKHIAAAARYAAAAVQQSRAMLDAFADVARDQSDRGAIATMAEYVYRPLKTKAKALATAAQE